MTPRLPGDGSGSKKQRNSGTIMAMIFMVVIGVAFVGFISLIMPDVLWLFVLGACFSGMIAIHYFTWGRWLMKVQTKDQEDDDAK